MQLEHAFCAANMISVRANSRLRFPVSLWQPVTQDIPGATSQLDDSNTALRDQTDKQHDTFRLSRRLVYNARSRATRTPTTCSKAEARSPELLFLIQDVTFLCRWLSDDAGDQSAQVAPADGLKRRQLTQILQ